MSTWFCIPSARPAREANKALAKWREMGYKIALFLDNDAEEIDSKGKIRDLLIVDSYPGYARAVNALVQRVMATDKTAEWFVTGGDDTLPDPNKRADEIAKDCLVYFIGSYCMAHKRTPEESSEDYCYKSCEMGTFGVMQPTGDRFAGGSIDRIAGSPWMGREWCLRANQGKGPLWPEFQHMFVDECLKCTAEKLGVYWMRPDLTHFHQHYLRASDAINAGTAPNPVPPHLVQWNSLAHWNEMKAIFERLKAEEFAPCMPLVEVCAK